jgi:hypothetical protein
LVQRAIPEISRAELSAVVRAVRVRPSRDKELRAAAGVFAAMLLIFLHSASLAAWNPSQAPVGAPEENQMVSLRQIAVVSSLAVSSSALAQNAVQWRVQVGGNGHWYELRTAPSSNWSTCKADAETSGGHLATLVSPAENAFVVATFQGSATRYPWIGLSQGPQATEPSGGWSWITGEALSWTNWSPSEPNGDGAFDADQANIWLTGEPGRPLGTWNDWHTGGPNGYIIEWSADCTNDGIVDYGQIRSGELADTNANNIPDCCDSSSSCPNSISPREWPVAVGGNGHWYQLRIDPLQPFGDFNARCVAKGGHMATLSTMAEHSFVIELMIEQDWFGRIGWPAIGLNRASSTSPWLWVTGEPVDYLPWAPDQPGPAGRFAQLWGDGATPNLTWSANGNSFVSAAVIEWSADCNNDGIVDFGQIQAGTLADTNANNVPDCCETGVSCLPCPADVDGSGAVNGVDLAAILNVWGTSGGKYPGADVNQDGIVDGSDLAEVLNGWGACP